MYGAFTSLGVRGIGGGNGFALNGLWVIDRNPGEVEDCRVDQSSLRGYCWIEAEYKTYGFGAYAGTEQWVWADLRPGLFYNEHTLGKLAAGDYGNAVGLSIVQQGSTTWNVTISANVSYYSGQSTGNTMYADAIRIGMELSGTQGWSAPVAHFKYNQWIDSNSIQHWQTVLGNKDPQTYPAYGNWAAPPNSTNDGGDWYTCVQNAGC